MIWLNTSDLKTHAFIQFIDESSADFIQARDESELQNMELIKSKLNGRYDIDLLFGVSRHPLIVRVLTKLVIYDIIRRNAARKIPSDIKDEYKWAMEWLDKVRDGKERPVGLQEPTDTNGDVIPATMWGNNTNDDNYI